MQRPEPNGTLYAATTPEDKKAMFQTVVQMVAYRLTDEGEIWVWYVGEELRTRYGTRPAYRSDVDGQAITKAVCLSGVGWAIDWRRELIELSAIPED